MNGKTKMEFPMSTTLVRRHSCTKKANNESSLLQDRDHMGSCEHMMMALCKFKKVQVESESTFGASFHFWKGSCVSNELQWCTCQPQLSTSHHDCESGCLLTIVQCDCGSACNDLPTWPTLESQTMWVVVVAQRSP